MKQISEDKMKHIFRNILNVLATAWAVSFAVSCDKSGTETEEYLSLTYYNVAGTWELVEWNGEPLAEGTYAYIELTRQGEFTSCSNIETTSSVASVMTGEFDIDHEKKTIGGYYDYMDFKQWSHWYAVSELTSDRMVWTATDDPSEVRVYSRIDAIPEGLIPDTDDEEETL